MTIKFKKKYEDGRRSFKKDQIVKVSSALGKELLAKKVAVLDSDKAYDKKYDERIREVEKLEE